jgi:hypothetical protein
MYAKLMSRITESSLMDEEIVVRYAFMMMLAIADPQGYVIGTDIAIARRMNIPLDTLKKCLVSLMSPDENSNSKEHEGRRVIDSDCERGYFVVNYGKYRDTRDEEHRREYMREYMRKRRNGKDVTPVNNGKQCKPQLAKAEEEVKAKEEAIQSPPAVDSSKAPDLATFCEHFSTRIACLGFPITADDWLMETHGYYASSVWPEKPPQNWKAMEGKLMANYRSRHAQLRAKTLPIGPNGKPQKPINDF